MLLSRYSCTMNLMLGIGFIALLGTLYAEESCKDLDVRCFSWKYFCTSNDFVIKTCPKTCDQCKVQKRESCGISLIPSSRIIAGQDAIHGAWPWQVLLKYHSLPHCGGTLISPRWVLTAAHCVNKKRLNEVWRYRVTVGEHNITNSEGTEVNHVIKKIIRHCLFSSALDYDIALLKLEVPVKLGKYAGVACLPDEDEHVPVGTECYITGWGKIKHSGFIHHKLQQAKLKVVENDVCSNYNKKAIWYPVTKNMLCAGSGGTSRTSGCHGDSGGPLVCKTGTNGTWVLHGVVSWGSPQCDSKNAYTVFARVAKLKHWIQKQMNTN